MKEIFVKCIKMCEELKLLYVEDNETTRKATKEMLQRFFKQITTAENGEDGLQKFQEDTFDIVLTDINMPVMDGIKMAEAIKDINKNVPILVLSAHNEDNFFISSIKVGIDGYLLKPLEINQLVEVLLKSVEKINLHRKIEKYQQKLENYNTELEIKVKERTQELEYRIFHDSLTELLNHNAMMKNVCSGTKESVFLIDINGFQKFNDIYGLEAGNTILKKFAKKLIDFDEGQYYQIYRVYGDEFVLQLKKNALEYSSFEIQKNRLLSYLENIKVYLDVIAEDINIEVTIGASFDAEKAFVSATMALHHAKKANLKISLYSEKLDSSKSLLNDLYWQSEIKLALHNDGVVPVFQAIVDKSENIIKYESLMRLRQYTNGEEKLITPYYFLNSAVNTGYYYQLTQKMLEKSFTFMKDKTVDFSVNLSFEDFSNPDKVQFLHNLIEKYGVRKRLIMEILESEMVGDYELLRSVLEGFREKGIRIAIDDFGSGYSNFEHILKLMPDYIKIDASLIKNILEDTRTYTLVKAIAEFSKELNIKVIAEYVFSEEIFLALKTLQIDEYQGYYFSIPSQELKS